MTVGMLMQGLLRPRSGDWVGLSKKTIKLLLEPPQHYILLLYRLPGSFPQSASRKNPLPWQATSVQAFSGVLYLRLPSISFRQNLPHHRERQGYLRHPTTSFMEELSEQITGRPQLMASSGGKPNPSKRDV